MSDSQQYEKVTVSSDGVTVDKRFEEDEFPVPAIAFEIRSERTVTVSITLVDDVPEEVAVEDLGFHPEYGSEYWTIDENEITFEREIEADSEYTTVYGIRATGTDNVGQFLDEPRLEAVDPPLDDPENLVEGSGSDVVRDVISGDSDSVPGLDGDEKSADEGVETLDLKDPNEPDEPQPTAENGDGSDQQSSAGGSLDGGDIDGGDIDAGTLCGALAAEIRDGNVDKEDVELLRKAFDLAGEDTGSVDARIKRLQTEVADLLAYTDALEEFLDENGQGDELIESFQEEVESFQSDLEEIRSLAEGHDETLTSLESDVESVRSSMSDLEANVEGMAGDIDDVESDVSAVKSEVDDVGSDVDDVGSQIEKFDDEIEELDQEVDELSDKVGDIDVGDVEDDIQEIRDEIQDLKQWREQLSSVIGGE